MAEMSFITMEPPSMFDPFPIHPPLDDQPDLQMKVEPRQKLEIKAARQQEHQLKVAILAKSHEFGDVKPQPQLEQKPKVQMIDSPSQRSPQVASDMLTVRQKLRESLTSALEMVVSKHLVKSVLGVVKDTKKETEETKGQLNVREEQQDAGLSHDTASLEAVQLSHGVNENKEHVIVDLGVHNEGRPKEEAMEVDASGSDMPSIFDYPEISAYNEVLESCGVAESPLKKLKMEGSPFVPVRSVPRREAFEGSKGGLQLMDQAKRVAVDIEAQLFKLCGFKKTYNQKARSLLFNLKDKSNPELRARVFTGEITPADLCRMSAEQLASRELSEWRNAKEQALDKWVVLTEADTDLMKIVKKTHKGEVIVNVQSENMVDIMASASQSSFPVAVSEKEGSREDKVMETGSEEIVRTKSLEPAQVERNTILPSLKRSRPLDSVHGDFADTSPSKSEELLPPESQSERMDLEVPELDSNLPQIMSLDEYMDAHEDDDKGSAQEDLCEGAPVGPRVPVAAVPEAVEAADAGAPSNTTLKLESVNERGKSEKSPSVKSVEVVEMVLPQVGEAGKATSEDAGVIWEGNLQLSTSRLSPVEIVYRSGEKLDLKDWPKSLEVKGRVRLTHLSKFLQELQQSRSRTVTAVSFFLQEGHEDSRALKSHLKEVATQYQMGDRVGFVEPAPGFELYLLPPSNATSKLLSEHGHAESSESQNKHIVLVGVVVWRRSRALSSSRLPDRNNSNLKRVPVANESPSESRAGGLVDMKHPSRDTPRATTHVSSALSSMHVFANFQAVSPSKDEQPSRILLHALSPSVPGVNYVSNTPPVAMDMPPGFTPGRTPPSCVPLLPVTKQSPGLPSAMSGSEASRDLPPGFWPAPPLNPTPAREPGIMEDDDDLPEFDFGNHGVDVPVTDVHAAAQFSVTVPKAEHPHLPPHFSGTLRSHSSSVHELPSPKFPMVSLPTRPARPYPSKHSFSPRNLPPQLFDVASLEASVSEKGLQKGRQEQDPRIFFREPWRGLGPEKHDDISTSYGSLSASNHVARNNDLPEWKASVQFPFNEGDLRGHPQNLGSSPHPRHPMQDVRGTIQQPPQLRQWQQEPAHFHQPLARTANPGEPHLWEPLAREPWNGQGREAKRSRREHSSPQ